MWSAMMSAILSSKLAIAGTAILLMVGGGAAVETTGLGGELRHSAGLGVSAGGEAAGPSASIEAEATAHTEAAVQTDADADIHADSQANVRTETNVDIAVDTAGGATIDVAADLHAQSSSGVGVRVGGSDADPTLSTEGEAQLQTQSTGMPGGAADAGVGIHTGTSADVAPSAAEAEADAEAEASVSYAALLEQARAAMGALGGQTCTDAFVTAAVVTMGTIDASLAEQAALEACAELDAEGALPPVPGGAAAEGSVGGALLLN
jgi:hypothetical protein